MIKSDEIKSFLMLIRNVATAFLESGSDTSMVEDSISNIILSQGYHDPNIYVTSTGVFYSFSDNNSIYNDIIRIKKRGINLTEIDNINKMVLDFCNHEIDFTQASSICDEFNKKTKKYKFNKILCAGLSTGFFAMLFGGSIEDFFISLICGILIMLVTLSFKRSNVFHFTSNLINSILTAIIALIATKIIGFGSLNIVITSSIMLIVPGLALTNSIKDTLTGNLVSGISRLSEVVLIAIAIASGIGITFILYTSLGGIL